jgi:hypothetical protein
MKQWQENFSSGGSGEGFFLNFLFVLYILLIFVSKAYETPKLDLKVKTTDLAVRTFLDP